MKPMQRAAALFLLLALLLPASKGRAETRLYVFDEENPPEELRQTAAGVVGEETTLTLTFAGDCTLGGETSTRSSRNSFRSLVAQNGMAYPFSGLQSLFATDDLTIVNMEGVLSESTSGRVKKKFNFLGDPAYTQVLKLGSVECVNLANNHTLDFGARALKETISALDDDGIGYMDEKTMIVAEKDGVRVGFTATLFSLASAKQKKLERQFALLRELGCAAIIHTMHAGEEYRYQALGRQRQIALAATELGAALVVGHHPHVVQNVEMMGGVPVVYSLGNCSFGGNFNPRDYDAALLRAELHFQDGALHSLDWTLWPISVSSEKKRNNFQPVLLTGEDAARVMEKIQDGTTFALLPFAEGIGARQETIRYLGKEE